jgi:arsenical pump membrane protein
VVGVTQLVAFSILALTVSLALGRPQVGRWRFDHATAALAGAALALLTGIVTPHQAMRALQLLALPVVTIVSLMVITLIAEQAGLLRLLAYRVARAARGEGRRLFAYLFIVGTTTGTVFTNDAAILILTPLVFALIEQVQEDDWTLESKLPFYFAVLYIGNLVGALVISNPINIVVSSMFGIRFLDYAAWMVLPALVSMVVSFIGLRLVFRRALPPRYRMPAPESRPPLDDTMLWPCAVVLGFTLLGFFSEGITGVPVWLVALSSAAILGAIYGRNGHSVPRIVRAVGWDVIVFVVGIFIVVIGMRNQGFAHLIGGLIERLAGDSVPSLTFVTGFVAAICSAFFNNHPTAGLMIWVIQDFHFDFAITKMLVFAALIGGDLGPKMLPIGSLAALMWFRMLRARGIKVSYSLYVRIGIPVTLLAVALSLLTLNLEWLIVARLSD